MKVELLSYTQHPQDVIEKAARTCYKSNCNHETQNQFIRGVIKSGHLSVIEHASATFEISGVSRALTHQLVRHRLASFSQQSQRYCKFDKIRDGEDNPFVIPHSVSENPEASKIFNETIEKIKDSYAKLVEMGIKAEDARFLLPNACVTTIVMTANFREWRHFIELRADSHAQWEIRELSLDILNQLDQIAPSVFDDLHYKFFSENI